MDFSGFREAIKKRLGDLRKKVYSGCTEMVEQTATQDSVDSFRQIQQENSGHERRTIKVILLLKLSIIECYNKFPFTHN